VKERGHNKEETMKRWDNSVEPMYKKYIEPQKLNADLIIVNS